MSHKRPTETSWDSEEELLNEGSAGIYAFQQEQDDDLDEDALLASDNEDDPVEQEDTSNYDASQFDCEPALEIMADEDQLLDDIEEGHGRSQSYIADDSDPPDYDTQQDNYTEDVAEEEEKADVNYQSQSDQLCDTDFMQHDTSQEADSTLPDSDSESEDEDKARGRFKSERSKTAVSVSQTRSRTDIPDTLEISEEQEKKINEFMVAKSDSNRQNKRGGNRMGPRPYQPGPRHMRHKNHQIRQNFQPRGKQPNFRNSGPRGPLMGHRPRFNMQQGPMLGNQGPFNQLVQQLSMFMQPNRPDFPGHSRGQLQNAMRPLQPMQGMMGFQHNQVPHASAMSHMASDGQKIHLNPHFQSQNVRPLEPRSAWQSSHPQPMQPPQPMMGSNAQGPRPGLQQPFQQQNIMPQPDLTHQQRQFQGPGVSWSQNIQPGNQPPSSMHSAQSQFTSPPRPVYSNIQSQMFPRNEQMPNQMLSPPRVVGMQQQHQQQQQQQQQHFSHAGLSSLIDQDERVQNQSFGSAPRPHFVNNLPQQRPILNQQPANNKEMGFGGPGRFSHMVMKEPEGQPIQTLVNKRMQGQMGGQVQINSPIQINSQGPINNNGNNQGQRQMRPQLRAQIRGQSHPGPQMQRPLLQTPGHRPPGHRPPGHRLPGHRPPGLLGSHPGPPRGPRPLIQPKKQSGPRPSNVQSRLVVNTHVPVEEEKEQLTDAELEELEKKQARAARFSQQTQVKPVKTKITLGKRRSGDSSGPSIKSLRTDSDEQIGNMNSIESTSGSLDNTDPLIDYDEEEQRKMQQNKLLAEKVKARKEMIRQQHAQDLARKRQQQQRQQQQLQQQQQQQQHVAVVGGQATGPSQSVTSTAGLPLQGALSKVPFGGVAKQSNGQWVKKVRVRDAAGVIKTKFIKISEEDAQKILVSGPGAGRGVPSMPNRVVAPSGRGRGGHGQGQPIERIVSMSAASGSHSVNIPLERALSAGNTVPLKMKGSGNAMRDIIINSKKPPTDIPFNPKPITPVRFLGGYRPNSKRFPKFPLLATQIEMQNPNRSVLALQRAVSFHGSEVELNSGLPMHDKQRRVVLSGGGDAPAFTTDTVMLDGISSGTTEKSICQVAGKVGPVAKCQIDKASRKALVQFKSVQHAGIFAQKFNRTMLDLAMISITLVDPN